jgi:hypothetical protein
MIGDVGSHRRWVRTVTDTSQITRSRSAAPIVVAAFVVLLPIGYVLSTGPAIWGYNRGYVPFAALRIYDPLRMICNAVPPISDLMKGYTDLWK